MFYVPQFVSCYKGIENRRCTTSALEFVALPKIVKYSGIVMSLY